MAVMVKFSSVTLSNIIQRNFPEEYAERRSEHETMTYAGVDLMPLFVMDVVLPCQKMALNIFEPRYRLMVRLSRKLDTLLSDAFVDSISYLFIKKITILSAHAYPACRYNLASFYYLEILLNQVLSQWMC